MRQVFLFVAFCALSMTLFGQQTMQYSQYMLNKYEANPAFAGFDRSLSITAGLRSQWQGLNGSPRSQYINAHLPLYFLNGSTGLRVHTQQVGISTLTDISGSFNYIMDLPLGILSVGLKGGVQQIGLDASAIRTPDGLYIDGAIVHNDPILASDALNQSSIVWGMGLMYAVDALEVGLAMDYFPDAGINISGGFFDQSSHVSLYGAYQLPIDDLLLLRPSLLIRSDGASIQTDVSVMAQYDQFLGGLGLRGYSSSSLDAVTIMGGAQLSRNVRITYSYDLGISGLTNFHDGTHEFMINYNLNRRINTGDLPPIIYNPRYE